MKRLVELLLGTSLSWGAAVTGPDVARPVSPLSLSHGPGPGFSLPASPSGPVTGATSQPSGEAGREVAHL